MEKIRISVYEDYGTDEEGKELIRFSRDDLIDIKLGIIAKEQDIYIRITKIEKLMFLKERSKNEIFQNFNNLKNCIIII